MDGRPLLTSSGIANISAVLQDVRKYGVEREKLFSFEKVLRKSQVKACM